MRTLTAAMLLLLLAGCASPSAPVSSGPTVSVDEPVAATVFQLKDCTGALGTFFFNDLPVRAALPPGYRPILVEGTAVAAVTLRAHTCDIEVGDTSYSNVGFAVTGITVGAPSNATAWDFYVFEWIFPVDQAPRLADALKEGGWVVRDAKVTVASDQVTVQGADVDYLVKTTSQGGSGQIPTTGGAETVRMHYEAQGHHAMLDHAFVQKFSPGSTGAGLVATKGTLSTFGPASAALWSLSNVYQGPFNQTDGRSTVDA